MKRLSTLHRFGWVRVTSLSLLGAGFLAVPVNAYAATTTNSATMTMGAPTSGHDHDHDKGSLQITHSTSKPKYYKATWTEPKLSSGDSVYLTGITGTQADSANANLSVLQTGHAHNGYAVVYFPMSQGGTHKKPMTFEMHTTADFESAPVGQMPEVPWAAGLPLLAAFPIVGALLRRKSQAR